MNALGETDLTAKQIFVCLAAYCEAHLEFTLDSLFTQASQPEQIHVALIDQTKDSNQPWLEKKAYWKNIIYVHIDPIASRGVCWARHLGYSFYSGEDYILQVDSHTWFDSGWDEKLLGLIATLQQQIDKPIITAYPPPFEFDENLTPHKTLPRQDGAFVMRPSKRKEQQLTETSVNLVFGTEYVKADFVFGFHVAGGFIFTSGDFVEEVPYDPYLYFHGEEQSLAIRAFTRGWNILHPHHDYFPIAHLYKSPGHTLPSVHWAPEFESQRSVKWFTLKERAEKRLCKMLYQNKQTGTYSLGSSRSLEDLRLISGIDYINKTIGPAPAPATLSLAK